MKKSFIMALKSYFYYLVVILCSCQRVSGRLLSSLTFIIDDTGSMHDDIAAVRNSIEDIFKIVQTNKDKSQFENFVLVSYNDDMSCPDNIASLRAKTNDLTTYITELNKVTPHVVRNTGCPECAMAGIKRGLEESLPKSELYLFTDASASDFARYDEIKALAQEKQSKIVFMLSGDCSHHGIGTDSPTYKVYENLADDTGGQIFNVNKEDLNDVLNYVKKTLKGRSTETHTGLYPGANTIKINVDPLMGEILIAITSKVPNKAPSPVSVTDPDGKDVLVKVVFEKNRSQALAFTATKAGPHNIHVYSTVSAKAAVSANSGVDFEHGFSSFKLNSLLDSSTLPVPGAKTHLMINLSQGDVTLKSVQILDSDDKVIRTLPLKLSDNSSSFYTTPEFDPPSTSFRIAIVGYHADSGSDIIRKTPTTIQVKKNKPGEIINNKAPSVLIEGESTLHVNYNDPLTLTCKAEAYPKPSIVWKKTDEVLSEKVVPGNNFPHDYANQLTLEKVSESATYTCEAKNFIASDSKQVAVEIIQKMQITKSSESNVNVEYEKEVSMFCEVDAYPFADITWNKDGSILKASDNVIITNSRDSSVSYSTLTIKRAILVDQGKYTCEAKNDKDKQSATMSLSITGLESPIIDKDMTTVTVTQDTRATIECNILQGKPKPSLRWSFKSTTSATPRPLERGDNQERIVIDNADISDSGTYRCVAENVVASDQHEIELYVQSRPVINKNTNAVTVIQGTRTTIECNILQGKPNPSLSWSFKSTTSAASRALDRWNNQERIKIDNADISDSGTYQCVAENVVASDQHEIQLFVQNAPKISKDMTTVTVIQGTKTTIECIISQGIPKPSLEWSFKSATTATPRALNRWNNQERIVIDNADIPDSGTYQCVAENIVDSDHHEIQLFVQSPPIIDKNTKTVTAIQGTRTTIECNLIQGIPRPSLSWTFKSTTSARPRALDRWNNQERIVIDNADIPDSGTYQCVAENVVDSDHHEIQLFVQSPPIIDKNTKTVTAIQGTRTTIECNLIQGIPRPSLSWTFKSTTSARPRALDRWNNQERIVIDNADIPDSGTYQCVAENVVDSDHHEIQLFVQIPATITRPAETSLTFTVNQRRKRLTCQAAGVPQPAITWMYQDIDARLPQRELTMFRRDSSLVLEVVNLSDEGKYTCVAKNAAGTASITYDVLVFEAPEIDKSVKTDVSVRFGLSRRLKCKILKGKPKPSIRWSFRLAKGDKDAPESFKLIPEWNDRESVTVIKAQKRNSGTYECQAENEISDDYLEINLRVEYPPIISRTGRNIFRQRIGSKAIIPCDVDGSPPPSVTWMKDDVELSNDGRPYRYEPRALTFVVNTSHGGSYTCRATNELSSDSRTMTVIVTDAATIVIPKKTNFAVPAGDRLTLTCRTKGFPAPAIQWYYQSFTSDAKTIISPHSTNFLNLRNIQMHEDGRYTCVATNTGGSMKLTYAVQVLVPVAIVNNYSNKRFVVVEGDLALQIKCTATGNPKPTITWTKDGSALTFGSTYSVENGVLIIKNIPKVASGYYQCEAENPRGKAEIEYEVFVREYPTYIPAVSKIVVEEGQTKLIECPLSHKYTDQLRWYKNGVFIQSGELLLVKASTRDSGYYLCRVSTTSKSHSSAVDVFVGHKPTFIRDENKNVNMLSTAPVSLNCESNSEPEGDVTWYLNGNKLDLKEPIYFFPSGISKPGEYKCEVENIFGSISRSFNATPEYCIIKPSTSVSMQKKAPLMVDSNNTWLTTDRSDEDLIIPKKTLVYFFCPSGFTTFPGSYLLSFCNGGAKFLIQGNDHNYFDVKCQEEIKSFAWKTGTKCMPGSMPTEKINMIYDVLVKGAEIVVYEVCIHLTDHTPVYTKQIMRSSLADDEFEAEWINVDHLEMNIEDAYECSTQVDFITNKLLERPFHTDDDCCFSKRQLVSPRDVFPGQPQRATYSYYNVVPHWGTCGTSDKNWNDVGQRVRNLAKTMYSELLVWTGVAEQLTLMDKYNQSSEIFISDSDDNNRLPVPLFLWKVIQDTSSASSLAIVQVNVPDLTREEVYEYIRCDDVCERVAWMKNPDWLDVRKGYTYCCTIQEFEVKFGFKGVFEPNMDKLL